MPKIALSAVSLHLDGVGEVLFERSARARRVTIYVRPEKGVKVVVPQRLPLEKAEEFVHLKLDWIKAQLAKWQQQGQKTTLYTQNIERCTKTHSLVLQPHAAPTITLRVGRGQILVNYPEHRPVTDEQVQQVIRKGVEEALRREAKQFLPRRLAELAQQHGLRYENVTIKNTRTRWGSCSSTNNINLSLHLMRLPDALCDYVLLHELAHTLEKNHGPGFWKLLDKLTGDARGLDKQLRAYRIAVF